jgi:hypothetical protein
MTPPEIGGMAPEFESPPVMDWQQFHQFLLQRMTGKTAEDRLRYAKQYAHVLMPGPNGQDTGSLFQLSPNKRIHIQKALSCLARFTGKTELWAQIRKTYGLTWSTGTEQLTAFTRFFDDSKDLDTMLRWLKKRCRYYPVPVLISFCSVR